MGKGDKEEGKGIHQLLSYNRQSLAPHIHPHVHETRTAGDQDIFGCMLVLAAATRDGVLAVHCQGVRGGAGACSVVILCVRTGGGEDKGALIRLDSDRSFALWSRPERGVWFAWVLADDSVLGPCVAARLPCPT